MKWFWKICLSIIPLTLGLVFSHSPRAEAQIQTIANTSYPSTIRVAIRAFNNPLSPILYVQTVGFQEYCEDVLPNEWVPGWSPEALKAGAIAVKMFAWYYTLHPTTAQGFTYDVDNTTNFQEFKYLSGRVQTDVATQETWNMVYVPTTLAVTPLPFRAGIPNNENSSFIGSYIMSQWGSEYWGNTAKLNFEGILNMYYPGYVLRFV